MWKGKKMFCAKGIKDDEKFINYYSQVKCPSTMERKEDVGGKRGWNWHGTGRKSGTYTQVSTVAPGTRVLRCTGYSITSPRCQPCRNCSSHPVYTRRRVLPTFHNNVFIFIELSFPLSPIARESGGRGKQGKQGEDILFFFPLFKDLNEWIDW